jgi:hypothetical protein
VVELTAVVFGIYIASSFTEDPIRIEDGHCAYFRVSRILLLSFSLELTCLSLQLLNHYRTRLPPELVRLSWTSLTSSEVRIQCSQEAIFAPLSCQRRVRAIDHNAIKFTFALMFHPPSRSPCPPTAAYRHLMLRIMMLKWICADRSISRCISLFRLLCGVLLQDD